ncbi:MAG: YitT family protein [Rikenellaceae bacterium]
MQLNTKNFLSEARAYIFMMLGLIIYSFAWTAILTPAQVVGGGIPGIGSLIFEATGGVSPTGELIGIPIGYSYFAINTVLIAIGFFILGPRFGAKTIFAMSFNSLMLTVFQFLLSSHPDILGIGGDKLLSAILGGALCGFGIGVCFWQGGSTGGTDIIAMILNKYYNISLGKTIIVGDILIVGSSYLLTRDITSIIYGYITVSVVGYAIDLFLQGNKQSCQIFIISKKYAEIADKIVYTAQRGATILNGEGWYTKQPQKIVMVTCRKQEANIIYRLIKEVDQDAFVTNSAVSGVYGNGFDAFKK